MTRRHPPRLALALLERLVSDSDPLAGDLIEEFARRQSRPWFWWQVLAAIASAWLEEPHEIRPLRLVDLQPADAVDRSRRLTQRMRAVNLSASPLPGIGGIGLVILAFLVTIVTPAAWWALVASALAGVLVAIALIKARAAPSTAITIRSDALGPR
jgi:hypothetical protein